MTRPALYWAVQYMYGRLNVMRVTRFTDKRVYGSIDGISTHCAHADLYGRFESEEDAKANYFRIGALTDQHGMRIAALEREMQQLIESRERNVRRALEGLKLCK